jgi:DNA primase catalytic core
VARILDAELARLKAEVSVQRLVEGVGVELRRQGADWVGRCPFHDDRSPSLVVSPVKNLWHCLGACRAGGGPVDWVMTAQGVSFRHAVELLREDSASLRTLASPSPLSAGGPVVRSSARKLAPLAGPDMADVELLGSVVGYYAQTLSSSPEALGFLARRRIEHPEAIEAFRLGYANRTLGYRLPGSQTKDGAALRSRLQALGILRTSGHEHFTGSLVIPVLDSGGVVGEVYGRKVAEHGLRAGTPLHLYLPGPHHGVFNIAAFAQSDELVVCESLIDALSLWCAGFRHVTAAYGVGGWTPEHQGALELHGIRRVLIAFDADPAGDGGAKALGAQLMAAGVECFRVELPRGADVNDVAAGATNATDALGRLLRKAAWMGAGRPPARATVTAAGGGSSLAAAVDPAAAGPRPVGESVAVVAESVDEAVLTPSPEPTRAPELSPAGPAPVVEPGLASPVPRGGAGGSPAVVDARELRVTLGNRTWRVRGLEKVTSFDALRVNVLAARTDTAGVGLAGGRFHVDTLDLYSARARSVFLAAAAGELRVEPEVVKSDLGAVLLACEARVEEVIAAAQAPKKVQPTISATERAGALDLLRDPNLIGRIEADFAAVGMVGEATNCLVGYLAAVSRMLPSPLAVIVQSTSAAGKSAVMEAVLGFVPEEDRVSFSAMTGQSLFYLGESDLAHKVLSIAEEEGASRATYALKLLQSEGELSIASTGKDTASGRLVTHTYKVTGPTAIVLTTTAIDIDEELLNRCLVLTVDEDREQTKAIHTAQRHAQTLAGLTQRTHREQVVALHRNAGRLLEPLAVVNPFAGALTFADGRTRTRRDHGKYLSLIAAVTLLHQHQRPRRTATVSGKQVSYVESTLADIEVANRLAHLVLGQSLDDLAPQTRRLLGEVHAHVVAAAKQLAVDPALVRFTRRQLREQLGWGDTQLKVHLARLVDLELVLAHRLDSGAYGYELTWRGEGTSGGPFLAGLTDPTTLGRPPAPTYDGDRSGPQGERSAPGRPPVGRWSAPGRTGPNTTNGALRDADEHEGSHLNGYANGRDGNGHVNGHDSSGALSAAVPGGH